MKVPEFLVGQTIASERYMGKITGAFFADDEWHYNIGENANLESGVYGRNSGYLIGPKYIKESEAVYVYKRDQWFSVQSVIASLKGKK